MNRDHGERYYAEDQQEHSPKYPSASYNQPRSISPIVTAAQQNYQLPDNSPQSALPVKVMSTERDAYSTPQRWHSQSERGVARDDDVRLHISKDANIPGSQSGNQDAQELSPGVYFKPAYPENEQIFGGGGAFSNPGYEADEQLFGAGALGIPGMSYTATGRQGQGQYRRGPSSTWEEYEPRPLSVQFSNQQSAPTTWQEYGTNQLQKQEQPSATWEEYEPRRSYQHGQLRMPTSDLPQDYALSPPPYNHEGNPTSQRTSTLGAISSPPDTYLKNNTLLTVFGCCCIGIYGIRKSRECEQAVAQGNVDEARRLSREAQKIFRYGLIAAIVACTIAFIIIIILIIVFAA